MHNIYRILADTSTSILKGVDGIDGLLGLIVKILSYGLGAAAVIGVVVAGIMYLTARDNESQVAAAKQRLLNTVIGLVAWVVMFSVVNWLIPGSVPDPENPSGGGMSQEDRGDTNPIEGGGTVSGGSGGNGGTNPPDTTECQTHPKRKDCFETYTSQQQMLDSAESFFKANERDMSTVLTNLYTVYAEKGYSFASVPQKHIEALPCSTINTLHYKAYTNGDGSGEDLIEKAGDSKGCEWG